MREVASAKRQGLTVYGMETPPATGREDCPESHRKEEVACATGPASAGLFVPEIRNEKCVMFTDLEGAEGGGGGCFLLSSKVHNNRVKYVSK